MAATAVASKHGGKPGGTSATEPIGAKAVAVGTGDPALAYPPQSGQALGEVAAIAVTVASDSVPPNPVILAVAGPGPWVAGSGPSATGSPGGPSSAPEASIAASSPVASTEGTTPGINGVPGAAPAAPVAPLAPGMANVAATFSKTPAGRTAATRQETLQPAKPSAPSTLNTNTAVVNIRKLDPAIPIVAVSVNATPPPVIPFTGRPGAAGAGPAVTGPSTGSLPGQEIQTAAAQAVASQVATAPEVNGGSGAAAPAAEVPDALMQTAVAAPASVVLPSQAPASLRARSAPPASEALTGSAHAPATADGSAQMQGIAATGVSPANVDKLAAASPSSAPPAQPVSVLDQVAPAVVSAAQAGDAGHRVSVSLNPDQLGTVTVTVDRNTDGTMHIQVSAEQIATLDMLRRDQGELVRALDQAGAGQGSPSLSFSLDSGSSGGWSTPGGHQDARPPAQFPTVYADEPAQAATWPGATRRTAAGSIDVTA